MIEPQQEQIEKGARILIISDTSDEPPKDALRKQRPPLTSGVSTLVHQLERNLAGEYNILSLNPYSLDEGNPLFPVRWSLPRYPQFELAIPNPARLWGVIRDFEPDAIFNVTPDGSLGRVAKLLCHFPGSRETEDGQVVPYALGYTTNLDEHLSIYVNHHTNGLIHPSPERFNPYFRLVFKGANKVLVPTPSIEEKLHRLGIFNTAILPRGVDTETFRPPQKTDSNPYQQYDWYRENPLPIYLYCGRVSLVKGIDKFLSIPTPDAHKVVIGDGPYQKSLEEEFTDSSIHFLGSRYDEDLANHVRFARLSFFPSLTDTWGQVVTESGASGVPVIAYNVHGPGEVVVPKVTGELVPIGTSLIEAIPDALKIDRTLCARTTAEMYSWQTTSARLIENLSQIHWKSA